MDLNPQESQEHARLLNEFVQAQERYKSLLPRVAVLASGQAPPPAVPGEGYLLQVQQADGERLLARESLYNFRAAHGLS
jgi:hypothetical protein